MLIGRRVTAATLAVLLATAAFAQSVASPVVPRGTTIKLMVIDEVATKTAKPGDRIKLRLDAPVIIDGIVVIAAGQAAVGEVVTSAESGIVGRSGKLATRLLYLDVGGVRVPIDGAPTTAGKSGNTQIILATVFLTPRGPFARGNNAKLKAGEIVTAVTTEDYAAATPAPAAAPSPYP